MFGIGGSVQRARKDNDRNLKVCRRGVYGLSWVLFRGTASSGFWRSAETGWRTDDKSLLRT
jgi:hypothetical protein